MMWSCPKHSLMEVALCRRMPSIVGAAGISFRVRASNNVLVKTTNNSKKDFEDPSVSTSSLQFVAFSFPSIQSRAIPPTGSSRVVS